MDPIGSVYAPPARRRSPRVAATAIALLAALACARRPAPAPRPPNVLLISLDSLRPDHLGCYGYRSATGAPTSPRLDRLAGEGVLFEHAVSTTSWTMPSHHALFSGLIDLLHGAISNDAGATPRRVQLAPVLARAGYDAAGFYSGPYLAPRYGFGAGFDPYQNVSGVEEDLSRLAPAASDVARATSELEVSYERAASASRVSDAGIAWLEQHGREHAARPFLLFLHYFDIHYDYVPPDDVARRFWPDGRLPRVRGRDLFTNPEIRAGMAPADLAGVLADYDGEIASTDEQVGRVLDRLAALKLADDTLVVVVSDHGDEFFEHGAKGHRQNLFESTLDVALIAALPGRLPAGRRVVQRVSLVDVAPTILDLAGALEEADADALAVPALEHGMWGRTLLPLIDGREKSDRDCVGFLANRWQDPVHPIDHWAVWTGGLKVLVAKRYEWIADASGAKVGLRTIERSGHVFDLARDPGEQHPLESQPRADVDTAIRRFDELFAADGAIARLMKTLPAGAPPRFASPEESAAEAERLKKLGYTEGPSGSLPPPPQFPRAR